MTETRNKEFVDYAMNKTLEKIEAYLLYATVFLVPLMFLPVFADIYILPKEIVLAAGVTLYLIIKSLNLIIKKKIDFATGNFDLPLLIIVLASIVGNIFVNNNKMDAFFIPGTTTILIGSFLLYLGLNNFNLTQKNLVKVLLVSSGIIVSLVTLISFSGILTKIPQLVPFLGNSNGRIWLAGGSLPEAIFLIVLLPICVELVATENDIAKKVFLSVGSIIIVITVGLAIDSLLPGKPEALKLPSYQTTVSVAFDSLKSSPLFGVGSGNYLSAFNRFKPVDFNSTDLWAVRFVTANSFYLTLITETGLFGLLGVILFFAATVKIVRKIKFKESQLVSFLLLVAALLFLPASTTVIVLLFVLASLSATTRKIDIEIPANLKFVSYLIAVPIIVILLVLYFFSYQAVAAEALFKNSLVSLNAGDGKKTYDLMRSALISNPYVDRYHAAYAQTNIALAQSLAQSKNLTSSDKQTISTLIQQAVREGKNTVVLNPTRSGNWELLARIYQAIMPFAQGVDQFTLQSYSQAIALDPFNPNLRIALGGVYYSMGKFDQAIDVFKLAVAAKPDLANAHFNLSAAYREKGEYDNAIAEMTTVLSLVAKDSPDYKTAVAELEALKKKTAAKSTSAGELTAPQKSQPLITPPLELPKEATPPATNR